MLHDNAVGLIMVSQALHLSLLICSQGLTTTTTGPKFCKVTRGYFYCQVDLIM